MGGARIAVVIVGVVVACASARGADAQTALRTESERRNQLANRHYEQGRFDDALRVYQSAFDLVPEPKYKFNIGLSREKLFDYEGCALAFQEFLRQTEGQADRSDTRSAATSRMQLCLDKTLIPIQVTSLPTNAAVFVIEGGARQAMGRTPQELKLPPATHEIVVEIDGYLAQSRTLAVGVGDRPKPDFVLEKLASLRVDVDPSGARVRIDESPWEPAPLWRQLRSGTHSIEVERAGYVSRRREVVVESGQDKSIEIELQPHLKQRTLAIRLGDGVARAEVAIDGQVATEVPVTRTLAPGAHEVRVTAPGRLPFSSVVNLRDDRDLGLVVDLRPQRGRGNRMMLWSLAGAAGAATVFGSVYGLLASSDSSAFKNDPTNIPLGERGEHRAERADLWLGTAAVLAGGGLLYFWLTSPHRSTARTVP